MVKGKMKTNGKQYNINAIITVDVLEKSLMGLVVFI
jgi:hypothetical protein